MVGCRPARQGAANGPVKGAVNATELEALEVFADGSCEETIRPRHAPSPSPGTFASPPVRVRSGSGRNHGRSADLGHSMKPFEDLHISEPGLVVIEVAAADDGTALAVIEEIGTRWRTSGPSIPWRVPGEPGVRVRTYADTRRAHGADDDCPWGGCHGRSGGGWCCAATAQMPWALGGSSRRMFSAPGALPALFVSRRCSSGSRTGSCPPPPRRFLRSYVAPL